MAVQLIERSITASEARTRLGQILKEVSRTHDRITIEMRGCPAAVLVSLEIYEQWRAQWLRAFELLEQASTRANLSEKQAAKLVNEAVAAVRGSQQP